MILLDENSVNNMSDLFQVATAPGSYLFPFRTEKSSPVAPMVLHTCGRVGRRHFTRVFKANALETLFLLYGKRVIKVFKVVNDPNDLNPIIELSS